MFQGNELENAFEFSIDYHEYRYEEVWFGVYDIFVAGRG